jgi:diguanylate cyclase (GGDEF)-like protein
VLVRPAEWAIRRLPTALIAFTVVVELVAVVLPFLLPGRPSTGGDWLRFGVLLTVGVAQAELSRRTERMRRFLASTVHVNMTSVWIFAGAVDLPLGLAITLTVVLFAHLWERIWRQLASRPAHRVIYTATTVVLSVLPVRPVLAAVSGALPFLDHDLRNLVAIAAAMAAFFVTNSALVTIALKLRYPDLTIRELFGGWDVNALELATLCLGGLTAVVLMAHVYLVPLVVLPIVVLHRGVLMRQFQEAATTDHKTGVLNSVAWHDAAARELDRGAEFGVLMIDLDHFKLVNDTHGHLVGDAVLREVADTLCDQVREVDAVGRFGGEEFVVLLPGAALPDAIRVAERIRTAIADLTVTDGSAAVSALSASIGVSVHPMAGAVLEQVLLAADSALYEAKRGGRNRVVSLFDPA